MSAPRFKKYIKAITVADGGTGYQPTGNIITSGDQQYALDYFGENYVIYYGQSTTTFATDLLVLISAPTSTVSGDTLVQATATLTLSSGVITAITLTEMGDGYITAPTVHLTGTPTSFTNVSTVDLSRDDGTYTSVATTSVDGIGTGATVDIIVESGKIVQILPNVGTNYRIGELLTVSPIAIGGTGSEDPINFIVSELNGGTGASFTVELGQIAKSDTYHKPKVYPIIKNQIPEFVREEYPTLATFVEKYYEFNDLNTTAYGIGPTNILHTMQDRMDLGFQNYGEETKTDFLDTFFEQYGKDFPVTLAADKNILLKNIKDFYTAKGSVKGIELLFRIMYNETVEVFVPNQYTLRPSDNVWSREYVVKVYANTFVELFGDFDTYDPAEFDGKAISVHYLESLGSVTTSKIKPANVTQVKEIAYTSPKAYELSLDIDPSFAIHSNGAGFEATAVVGGKIATINTISAADSSRTAGTYTVPSSGSTASVTGAGATFTVVIDSSGAATITVTAAGDSYAPLEIITILDSTLGGGGGASLTFKVATITDGKINSVTITSGGLQYTSNPQIRATPAVGDTITTEAQLESRISGGKVTSILFTDDVQGLGYNNPPIIRTPIYPTATYLSLASEDGSLPQHNKALVQRILSSAVYKSNSGAANGGFRVGETFSVNEGSLLAAYATDYFADDYTLLSLANNAFVRISKLDSAGYPSTLEVISIGIGFQTATFDFAITSRTGATATLTATTGYNAVYPGVYETTSGFLSNVNRLQDNKIYQAFSYQIRSDRPKSDWGEYVKRAAHPAGMIGYADLQITGAVDVGNTMSVDTDLIFYVVTPDIEVVELGELVTKDIVSNGHVDTFATAEPIFFTGPGLGKLDIPVMQDAAPIFDVESVLTEAYQVDESTAFAFERNAVVDSYAMQDVFTREWVALLSRADTTGAGDAVNTKDIRPVLADSVRTEDEQAIYAIDYFLEDYVANNNPEFVIEKNNILDTYNAGDAPALEFVLSDRTDSYTAQDTPVVVLGYLRYFIGATGDDVVMSDVVNELHTFKVSTDSVGIADTPSLQPALPQADSYATQDAITREWVALLSRSDSYTGQDVAILHPGSAITDTYTAADSAAKVMVNTLTTETYTVGDVASRGFNKNGISDSGALQDVSITTPGLHKAETAQATTTNVVTFPGINRTDAPVTTEGGSITMQDFIGSSDYFLEDYVASEVRSIS